MIILEMRMNPLNMRREYYVHYDNLDRRLDEWIDGEFSLVKCPAAPNFPAP